MNHLLSISIAVVLATPTFAQSPDLFNYQGIARDNAGAVLQNQNIGLQITIRETSNNGNIVYQETHSPTTNQFGLFTVQVGAGTVVSGSMGAINWGSDAHFMEVEMDETGGSNYQQMGTSQLISVPYAKHAETVENDAVDDADADSTNELQVLSTNGDTLFISNGNFVILNSGTDDQNLALSNDTLYIEDGNSVYIGQPNDADWDTSGNYTYNTTDSIGIGTASPTEALEVAGSVKAEELVTSLYKAVGLNQVTLSNSNLWGPVPNLTLNINVTKATNAIITYQFSGYLPNVFMLTRLKIDGNVIEGSKAIVGHTEYFNNNATVIENLGAGAHTIEVEYRTPGGGINHFPGGSDYQTRTLSVLVLGN